MKDVSGESVKGYDLLERIGAGGFGAVYRAKQSTVGREVAVKIILPGLASQPDFIRRFEAEAQLVAQLEHMHIVPLYDYWRNPSGAYLVMRLLRGGSLKDTIERGPYDLQTSALILDQVASALQLAHRNNVIHRDIKPGNILMDEDGNAYLADFGIAKVIGDLQGDMTRPDSVVGSLDYISPEQARSDPVSPRTDIYSLGVVLYEMLVGEHPFPVSSSVERLYKHLNEQLPDVSVGNGQAEAINAVIQQATAKKPADRYDDVLAMSAAFRKAAGLDSPVRTESIVEQLTMREQEVLKYIVEGLSNNEIAEKLFITVGTVKWYITQIYKKLGVRSRVQAIVRARELNLVVETGEFGPVESAVSVSLPEPQNPYKGLRAFQAADHRHFFGREALVTRLLDRLASSEGDFNHRFLAVVGPSGSGKSSVVRAGLVPALWRGDLPGSERWFIVEMIPGAHPLDELEVGLIKVAANQSNNLMEQLQRDLRGLVRVGQLILPDDDSELVVVIDQFEELFTLLDDEEQRTQFLELLYTAATDPRSRIRIIVTMRADFYDRPLYYADFGQLLRENMETIMPLSAKELERAITRPAAIQGVTFEPGLVPTIIDDVSYQPGALPLLQYALTELFERRQGRVLTQDAYVEMGGTVGALAKRADELYTDLDTRGQELVRQMFMRLVMPGEGAEDTRRRVERHELQDVADSSDLMDEIIDSYAAFRLLALDHDPATREPTVELAHEAILREWDRLRDWINESRADINLQLQLARAAEEWLLASQDPSYLLRGGRLEQFEGWQQITTLALTDTENEYLEASLSMREKEDAEEVARQAHELALERRSQNRLRAMVAIFAIAALVAVALSIIAFNQRETAQENEALAITRQQEAMSAQEEAEVQSELAATRAAEALEQRTLAEEQSALADEQRAAAEEQRVAAEDQKAIAEEQQAIAESNLARSESQRLAGLANNQILLEQSMEVAALLAMRGLNEQYTREADIALQRTTNAHYAQQLLEPGFNQIDLGFSPNGRYVQIAEWPGDEPTSARQMWDLETSEMLWEIDDYTLPSMPWDQKMFTALDDAVVATPLIDEDQTWIGLLDLDTGQPLRRFEGPAAPVTSYDISPDGQTVVAVTEDGVIYLWDVLSGEEIRQLNLDNEESGFILVQFSPDNRTVAARMDGTTVVFDGVAGQEIHRFIDEPGRDFRMEFSPDGQLLMTYKSPELYIWDLVTGEKFEHNVPQTGAVTDSSIQFLPDSNTIAVPYTKSDILLWDLAAARESRIFSGHKADVWYLALSPDGRSMLSGSTDNTVRRWDVETGEQLQLLTTDGVTRVKFAPDGLSFASSGRFGSGARVWTLEPTDEWNILLEQAASFLQLSPDGNMVLTKNPESGLLQLLDSATGQHLVTINETIPGLGSSSVFHFSWDGSRIVTVNDEGAIVQYDSQNGELLSAFPNPEGIYLEAISYIPGTNQILAAGGTGAYIVDSESGDHLIHWPFEIEVLELFAGFLAVSPDGQLGAVYMPNAFHGTSETYIFNLRSGDEILVVSHEDNEIPEAFAFSHDSRLFAWGGNTNVAHVIDLETGEDLFTFPHTRSVLGLAFSPDDSLLLSGSFDGTASLFDMETGELVRTLEGATGGVGLFVDFTPDGEHALLNLVSENRIARVPVTIETLIESMCQRVLRDLTEEERSIYNVDETPTCPKFADES